MKPAPQFFRHGPSLLVRLSFYLLLSLVLMIEDLRFNYSPQIRQSIAMVIYPLQRMAYSPVDIANEVDALLANFHLVEENSWLKQRHLKDRGQLLKLQALKAENKKLHQLFETALQIEGTSSMAEIIYASRDPFNHKVILNKGRQNGIQPGQIVVDDLGVVGQVTQVYLWSSEVTLITDKDHSVPVLATRNGLRTVISGAGKNDGLELRYLSVSTDIQLNDLLVTSGVGGVYPSGLPVAIVTNVERNPGNTFATVICTPIAGVNQNRQVLILSLLPPITEQSLKWAETDE